MQHRGAISGLGWIGLDGSPGGVKYRAPYGANNLEIALNGSTKKCPRYLFSIVALNLEMNLTWKFFNLEMF